MERSELHFLQVLRNKKLRYYIVSYILSLGRTDVHVSCGIRYAVDDRNVARVWY